jgi:Family of unknown function (DUF6113)
VSSAPDPPAAVAYGLLFAFGALQGLTGSFQYGRDIGPIPVAAAGFVLAIGATCWLCAVGLNGPGGAVAPAAGWAVTSFALAISDRSGTVVITNSTAGAIYLYGGALCAAVVVGFSFFRRSRPYSAGLPPPKDRAAL